MKRLFSLMVLLCTAVSVFAVPVRTLLFPADFQKNEFALAEDFPGTMYFCCGGGPWTSGSLTFELPEGIVLNGASYLWNVRMENGRRVPLFDIVQTTPVTGGMRYEIILSRAQLDQARHGMISYQLNRIYFTAQRGLAGKTFNAKWHFTADGKVVRQGMVKMPVIPALKMPQVKTANFSTLISFLYSYEGAPIQAMKDKLAGFWRGLAQKDVITMNFMNMPSLPGYAFEVSLPSIDQMPAFRPNAFEDAIRKGKMLDKYPHNPKRMGMYSVALTYLTEDPNGDFMRYYEQGVKDLKQRNPQAKYVFWNYEPGVHSSCDYDWQKFSEYVKAGKKLTKTDIDRDYSGQWKQWRFVQTSRVIRQVSQVFRKHWPEAKLILCGANVYPDAPDLRDPYCATDPRMYDDAVDFHSPMSYYGGTKFFDHTLATAASTRKGVLVLVDPAEMSRVFYERYPDWSIRQSIVAAAAMGCAGIGFYPYDSYDARKLQAIADGFAQVAPVDEIYTAGQDITAQCKWEPANVVELELANAAGKVERVELPELVSKIRFRVHKLNGRYAVTLLNYYENREVFVRLTVPGFCNQALFKVSPRGYVISQKVPDQAAMKYQLGRELQKLKDSTNLHREVKDGATTEWRSLNRKLHFAITTTKYGPVTSMYDSETAAVRSWMTPGKIDLMRYQHRRGFLGRVSFLDQEKMIAPDYFHPSDNMIFNRWAKVVFVCSVKGYDDAQAERYPFEGMVILNSFDQTPSGYQLFQNITVINNSPQKKPITTALRVQSFPYLGWSMAHSKFPLTKIGRVRVGSHVVDSSNACSVFIKPGKNCPWGALTRGKTGVWDSRDLFMEADYGKRREAIRMEPDDQFTTCYSWWEDGNGFTGELITDRFTLPYGAQKRFRIIYSMDVR